MRIEENRVYVFSFNVGDHGDLAIPVRGETREAAAARLQSMFSQMQTELAMEFPVIKGVSIQSSELPIPNLAPGGIPPEVLEMRINTLLTDLGASGLTDAAKAQTIKNFTKIDFSPENYPAIISRLEEISAGVEEEPPAETKGKKK